MQGLKTFIIALVTLLATTAASAQETAADQAAQLHRGSLKMWIGVGLVGAGALILPITDIDSHSSPSSLRAGVAVGFVAVGSGLVWLGAVQRHKAVRPQTTIGVFLGRNNGLQLRRTW